MTQPSRVVRGRAETAPGRPCTVCWSAPSRPGRRDHRCGTCAAYWHRYHRDRTETLIIKNNIRLYERTLLSERTLLW